MNEPHLNAFGIKNFKSFKGEHWFNLKNITFLIGKNSSGKSSFVNALRISQFHPFKDDFDSDLGLKENWINNTVKNESVEFSSPIHINYDKLNRKFHHLVSYYPKPNFKLNILGSVFFKYYKDDNEITEFTEHDFNSEEFWPTTNSLYDSINKSYLTSENFYSYYDELKKRFFRLNKAIDDLCSYRIKNSEERELWVNEKQEIEKLVNEDLKIDIFGDFQDELFDKQKKYPYGTIINLIDYILNNYDNEILKTSSIDFNQYLNKSNDKGILNLENRNMYIKDISFQFINLPVLKELLNNILKEDKVFVSQNSDRRLDTLFQKFHISNIFYNNHNAQPNETYVDRTDRFFGNKDIYSLISNKKSDFDFDTVYIKNYNSDKKFLLKLEFINKYLNIFNIGEELIFEKTQTKGKTEIIPYILKNNEKKEIFTYFGYGVQILIPLLFEILINDSPILLIEEPESNLHPALQSKLADFFVEIATKFNKQLVIETHSEYIIRRMQYLVANTNFGKNDVLPKIKSENANIYYFNDPSKLEKQSDYTYEINFKNDGGLSKPFGPGFFDVTDDIAYELFMLKNKNFN